VGLKSVLLPAANERDFAELPDYITRGMRVSFVSHFDEVVAQVFRQPKGGGSRRSTKPG